MDKRFWRRELIEELIKCMKAQPAVYSVGSEDYMNRTRRTMALHTICRQMKEIDNDLSMAEVKRKMHTLRTQYLRELKKMEESKSNGADLYEPSLWCFEQLSFLRPFCRKREPIYNNNDAQDEPETKKIWPRKTTKDLIALLKRFPCLYNAEDESYRDQQQRRSAYKCIYEVLKKTNNTFSLSEIKERIRFLRTQYVRELRAIERSKRNGTKYVPLLWCIDQLTFLEPSCREPSAEQKVELRDENMDTSNINDFDSVHTDGSEEKFPVDDDPLNCITTDEDSMAMPMDSNGASRIWVNQSNLFSEREHSDGTGNLNNVDKTLDTSSRLRMSVEILKKTGKLVERITENMEKSSDDIAIFAKSWETSYRKLSEEQQIFAKKAIEEILVFGQLNRLTLNSVKPFN